MDLIIKFEFDKKKNHKIWVNVKATNSIEIVD